MVDFRIDISSYSGCLGSLLKLRNITHFFLWKNFTSNFLDLTNIEISNELINLKEIAMSAFIDYVRN